MNEAFAYDSDFVEKLRFTKWILSSLRSRTLAVTLFPPLAGQVGKACPFPALKAVFDPELRPKGAFLFLLTFDGTPPLPLTSLRDRRIPHN